MDGRGRRVVRPARFRDLWRHALLRDLRPAPAAGSFRHRVDPCQHYRPCYLCLVAETVQPPDPRPWHLSGKLHLHLLEHSPDDQQQRRVGGRLPALALPPVHQEFFSWDCGTHPYRPAARPDHSLTCGREDLRPGGTTDRRDHRHGNHHARALFFPSSLARIHLFS
jgi:hypothetical protein